MYSIADRNLLCKNLWFLRKRKGLSLNDYARYVGMSGNELLCIEHGLNDYITTKALEKLCRLYDMPKEEILTEDLEKKYAGKRLRYFP